MNLILIEQKDYLGQSTIELKDRRLQHIRKIHRAKIGDRLRVGKIGGLIGWGEVAAIDDEVVRLHVELMDPPPDSLELCLAIALPRPPTLQKVLQYGTSLGVKHFVFFHSKRVEKSYWQSHALREKSLFDQLCLGLEQAKDTIVPQVHFFRRYREFVDDFLSARGACGPIYVADPSSESVDMGDRVANCHKATLVLGPEGGLLSYEVDRIVAVGARKIHFGDRILRVEVAATVAVSLFKESLRWYI